jgi:hypothetical protein
VWLAAFAAAPPVLFWLIAVAAGLPHLHNDFHSYWYAGRLLAEGSSPYELEALRAIAARHGDDFMVGTGYSYPLPFAFLMVPLSRLPFDAALVVFNGLSIALFAVAVAIWLQRFHPHARPAWLRLAAALCGGWPPVLGSVVNGQANLLVLAALAAAVSLVLGTSRARTAVGGVAIGLAAVVKLVPGVLVVPLWLAGHRRAAITGAAIGFLAPLGVAAVLYPSATADGAGLATLLGPDPFVTNQSINGFVSRLVESSDRMTALAPGAFDPALPAALLTLSLAAATVAVLWWVRSALATWDGLAAGLALSLVAATAGAPKTSLWNLSLELVAIGLLLARVAPSDTGRSLDSLERGLLVAWWASAAALPLVWLIGPLPAGPMAALVVLLGSLGLYGSLSGWVLAARRLLRLAPRSSDVRRSSPAGRLPAATSWWRPAHVGRWRAAPGSARQRYGGGSR